MALRKPYTQSVTSEEIPLGNVSQRNVGRFAVWLTDGGSWSGSIEFLTRLHDADGSATVAKAYTTPTSGTLAVTAITALPALVFLTCDGESPFIDHTRTAGTLNVEWKPLDG